MAQATSPYLRSAAHQPVNWMEWGEAAFERATREGRPILLDIGAVWCHWCHVLDRESYENQEIARVINQNYVPVKVDRDERPDIDARYQMAVSALTGQGGWPLTAFLTPEGKPFFGGTYFPPDDRYGRPGMKRILETIAQNYRSHRDQIHASADQIAEALNRAERFEAAGGARASVVADVVQSIEGLYDSEHGGFGQSPKFPHPSAMELLLDQYLERGQRRLLDIVTQSLESMGRGGVYDQVGGGFHRYSVDRYWRVPHFEKMSYDNAGLLGNYVHAYQLTGKGFLREIALGILSFVESVLSREEGGFYASQDADYSLDDDGDYFTWTLDELKAVLDEQEARAAALRYDVGPTGEMHHNPGKNVLFIDQPVEAIGTRMGLDPPQTEDILARARRKLLKARDQRPTPFVDRSLYAGWNAMMASALLEAYKTLGLDGARHRALMALDLFLDRGWDADRGVAHVLSEPATATGDSDRSGALEASNFDILDDQVLMAAALLDAFEVTGELRYFEHALQLGEIVVRRFWDQQEGGFFDTALDTSSRQGALTIPRKALQDSPTPAGNPVAVALLDRLAFLADRPDLREKAGRTLDLFASKAAEYGLHAATYALALAQHLRPPTEVVVIGRPGDADREALLHAAYQARAAGKRVLSFSPETVASGDLPRGLASTLPNLQLDGDAQALVCSGTSCQPPSKSVEELVKALRNAGISPVV
ncbi:MAG TPA: thioredoxin domain-containing protein [Terriglobia bacterium]|nr:thioredoxin domain-containing protein [Terriglobia bacterium]